MIRLTYDYCYASVQCLGPAVVWSFSIDDTISYHKITKTILNSIEVIY